ncbi:GNAT family N-acetyltransferase [Aerococcus sp. 1KP-2016]|jgi:ribosomal-protein-alanine N-acetyltransferase|uniref:GNAT family N-acetyltransferase n=1 Tax=Aerococcus sp. 1KP-2016 TaxID=1981982 RepID=UPI000B997A02|nr:GNAT family protein [Aerococcus sp. 1KP-2016]OYQ66344.1 GNAT family N-acetyltransferase [Aerococcus sp. 1KP-2016]
MNHKGTKTIETQHLLLRKFEMSDAKDMFHNWAGNMTDTKFVTWQKHGAVSDSKDVIEKWDKRKDKNKTYRWCVEEKASGQAIGEIEVVEIHRDTQAADLVYCMGKAYKEKGLAKEALQNIIHFLFKEVQMNRISFDQDVANEADRALALDLNFEFEGVQKQALADNTGIADKALYGAIRQ